MTILSAHQPVYLPGLILFNKIALSDIFVLLSHVQFERSSWQMRNRVRSGSGPCFLSIPIRKKGRLGQTIDETEIAGDGWKEKHLKTLFFNYNNRPYFKSYFPEIEAILRGAGDSICALNSTLVRHFCRVLELNPTIIDSKMLNLAGAKSEMLVSLCKACNATDYVSNLGSAAYIEEHVFTAARIRHHWQKFEHPRYEQGADEFIPNLSVVDLLFNVGPEAGEIVKKCGRLVSLSQLATTV